MKLKRTEISGMLLKAAEAAEQIADELPSSAQYARGLQHGRADAFKAAADLIDQGFAYLEKK